MANESDTAALQKELAEYKKAIEEEYTASLAQAPDDVEKATREFFKKNVNIAAAKVVFLAENAESEAVSLSASKFVIEQAYEEGREDGDPIKKLLNSLSKNDKKSPAPVE